MEILRILIDLFVWYVKAVKLVFSNLPLVAVTLGSVAAVAVIARLLSRKKRSRCELY